MGRGRKSACLRIHPFTASFAAEAAGSSTSSLPFATATVVNRYSAKLIALAAYISLAASIALANPPAANPSAGGFAGVPDEAIQSLLAATTPTGKTLSAAEVKPLIVHAPRPKQHLKVMGYMNLKIGVFLLTVRPDGTVEKVEILQSLGAALADNEVKQTFKKWRFRPNSVTHVRVPGYYRRTP
jgi:TonB family protein